MRVVCVSCVFLWTSLFFLIVYLQVKKPNTFREYLSFRYHRYFETNVLEKCRAALKRLAARADFHRLNRADSDLVITIVTMFRPRTPQQYFHMTLQSILREAESEDGNFKLRVIVCNSQLGGNFPAYLSHLRHKLTVIRRKPPFESDIFDKERADYAFCLSRTLMTAPTAKHVLMMEDDAVLRSSGSPFFPTLRHVISQAERRGKFAYLKLYHPPRLLGYLQPEIERHLEVFAICAILFTALRLASQITARCRRQAFSSKCSLNWLLVFYFLILLLYMLDRHWVLEIRGRSMYTHLLVPASFCCTQGILFQRMTAMNFGNFLNSRTCNSSIRKDHLLYDFYRDRGLRALYIQPNLMAHIGSISTLQTDGVETINL